MTVWSQAKVCGCRLSLRPIDCTTALSVTQKRRCNCSMQLVWLYKCYMSLPLEQTSIISVIIIVIIMPRFQASHKTCKDSVWLSSGTSQMYWSTRSTLTICFSVSVKYVTTPLSSPVIDKTYEIASPTKPANHSSHRTDTNTHTHTHTYTAPFSLPPHTQTR